MILLLKTKAVAIVKIEKIRFLQAVSCNKVNYMVKNHKALRDLNDRDPYPCPVCRVGEISGMPLMDAMACNFCRHIFTVNLPRQQLVMADRQPPLIWHWDGKKWIGAHLEGVEFGWNYLLLAIAFIAVPPTLTGLSAYYFPPVPGSPLSWLPLAWTGLTFLSHLIVVGWLVIEFYQLPVGLLLSVMGQNLISRRTS